MKLFNKIFCLASFTLALSACNNDQLSENPLDEYFAISKITINETKNSIDNENIILKKNSKVELSCIVSPDNASDKSLLWTSSDETVATVSIDGVVEAKDKEGSAVISVTPAIGFGATDAMTAVKVQVVDNYVDIEDFNITAEGGKTEMFVSETLQLTATVTNQDATFKRFTWKSSNDEIATVDPKTGLVTGISEGNVTITATTDDFRSEPVSKDYSIEIEKAILLKDLTFTNDPELSALGYGQTYQIQYKTEPSDATRTLISWESSNPDITVDNGVIKVNTITEGSATITAKTTKEDGTELVKTVNVSVAKGRFDFSFGEGLAPWTIGTTGANVSSSSNGKTTVNMALQTKDNTYRADLFLANKQDLYINAKDYPIVAVRITAAGNLIRNSKSEGSFKFEILDADNSSDRKFGGSYKGDKSYTQNSFELLKPNPIVAGQDAWIYFDLRKNFDKAKIPTEDAVKVRTFKFIIADNKDCTTYDIYWVKTFKDVEELQNYVNEENQN